MEQRPDLPIEALDPLYERLPTALRGLPGSGLPRTSELFNPREIGGTLALLAPIPLVLLGGIASRRRHLALGLAGVVQVGVLLLSQTPSAIAGLALAGWLAGRPPDRPRRRWWLLAGVGFSLLGIGVLAILRSTSGSLAGAGGLGAEAPSGRDHNALGLAARLELWPRALQMMHDTAYTGIGLNTFPWVMDRFYPGNVLGPEVHAHNFYLQTGVDLGLPGLVGLIWLLLAFFLSLTASVRRAPDAASGRLGLAVGAGLLSHLIFGTLDAVTLGAKPGLALWAALGLGAAIGRSADAETSSEQGHAAGRRLDGLMALVLLGALLAPLAWGGPELNAGRVLAYRALLPESPVFRDHAVLVGSRAYLESAVRAEPANSGTWYLLGAVLARLPESNLAVEALRRGVLADQHAPLERYALGDALLRTAGPTGWSDLRAIFGRWTVRYPERAEWYLTQAIALDEGFGDHRAALALIERGLALGAEPRTLLEAYQSGQ